MRDEMDARVFLLLMAARMVGDYHGTGVDWVAKDPFVLP